MADDDIKAATRRLEAALARLPLIEAEAENLAGEDVDIVDVALRLGLLDAKVALLKSRGKR